MWDRQCSERALYEALKAWWIREGLSDRGLEKTAVVGAVLVCRLARRSNPQRYVEVCLARGVHENWLRNARQLLQRHGPRRTSDPQPSPEIKAQWERMARGEE